MRVDPLVARGSSVRGGDPRESAGGRTAPEAAQLSLLHSSVATPIPLRSAVDALLTHISEGWRCTALVLAADLAAMAVVAVLFGAVGAAEAAVAFVIWLLGGLHRPHFTVSVLNEVPRLAAGCAAAAVIVLAAHVETASQAATSAALLFAVVVTVRCAAYVVVRWLRRNGREAFPVLVVGCGPTSDTLVARAVAHPETGMRVVGRLGSRKPTPGAEVVPFHGPLEQLAEAVRGGTVRHLIVCEADEPADEVVETLRCARRPETTIEVVPALHDLHALERAGDEIWGLPLVRLCKSRREWCSRGLKRTLDVTVAAVVLVLTLPLIGAVALAVRWELGPHVLYRQERVGLYGRRFKLLKFRSVRPGLEADHAWSASDCDVGRVGRFLRKYSLDELPQLWNVLRGDMSLVGPRPERPEFVERFAAEVPAYHHRHRVPVGMTGLAAVRGLRGASSSIAERAYFDNLYIETWSFWLDIKVLLLTVRSVLRGTGG